MTTPRSVLPSLLFTLTLGIGLLVTGCKSTAPTAKSPGLPERFPNHSVDEIQRQILRDTDTLRSFSATARITVRSPEETQSFNAVVRQQRADSLFMRFSLFGIEGGRLLLTPDSVFYYDTRKGVLRVGPVTDLQEIFPGPVSSGRLFENMLGLIAPEPTTSWTVQADSSRYYLTNPIVRERYAVDPRRWRVVRYVKKGFDGTVVQKRLFSRFKTVEGILMPHRVSFRRPPEGLAAVVTYREVNLNPSRLSFTLDVPPQVPRKPFR